MSGAIQTVTLELSALELSALREGLGDVACTYYRRARDNRREYGGAQVPALLKLAEGYDRTHLAALALLGRLPGVPPV